jgi:hypothetical protein
MLMDIVMIVLAILNLCGVISGTVVSIYGIVFACVVAIAAVLRGRD